MYLTRLFFWKSVDNPLLHNPPPPEHKMLDAGVKNVIFVFLTKYEKFQKQASCYIFCYINCRLKNDTEKYQKGF